jgi:hypothetical protein
MAGGFPLCADFPGQRAGSRHFLIKKDDELFRC